jgi:hypothetical protein
MEPNQTKMSFDGLGPIPSSKTTFAQGIGMGGSFAPVWTDGPILPAKRQASSGILQSISVCVNGAPGSMQVYGTPPEPL